MKHPNIVPYKDSFVEQDKGLVILIMEYCECKFTVLIIFSWGSGWPYRRDDQVATDLSGGSNNELAQTNLLSTRLLRKRKDHTPRLKAREYLHIRRPDQDRRLRSFKDSWILKVHQDEVLERNPLLHGTRNIAEWALQHQERLVGSWVHFVWALHAETSLPWTKRRIDLWQN